ncbi:MAG: PorT family protein [Candidatus Amulumruptor caecigallinarius]|nr:PorT family protein [Candidatus Amulumruptor caecigallinarius]
MSVFAGPAFSVGLSGKLDTPDGLPDYTLYGSNGVWRRFNVAATFGVAFEIDKTFSVNITGNLGLNSMPREDIFLHRNSTESVAQICATYWLGN